MISSKRVEKFLVGNHYFLEHEFSLKYHFMLINSLLLAGFAIGGLIGIIRVLTDTYILGAVNLLFSSVMLGLFFYLRKKKSAFKIVTNISLVFGFIFSTSLIYMLQDGYSKFLWYALFITAVYLLQGYKRGLFAYGLVISTLVLIYFISSGEAYLLSVETLSVFAAYSTLTLFLTFSEIQQDRYSKNLQSSSKRIENQNKLLYQQIRTDNLTSLPNETALREKLESSSDDISYLVLEINDFDIITNEFGDEYSKELLKQVSEALSSFVTKSTSLYYIGNCRFAFLIENPEYEQDIALATTIDSLFENLKVGRKGIEISISFLIAIVREKSDKILSNANITISEMKKGDKDIYYKIYKFDKDRESKQKSNIYWTQRLGELISEDKIVVYYQPIVDNTTKEIVKYESLVRAIDNNKIVSPYHFLAAAKSKGVLTNITKIVIDKSFQEFSKNSYDFSINITEHDLNQNYLADYLRYKAKVYKIDPNRLYLEILENINSQDSYSADTQFKKLREFGFKLSIDDFGAEASNLSRLLTLQADIIKIDAQFIKNLDSDTNSVKIVETIVSLAKKMNVKTVAEFVHNQEIYEIVKELGVDYSQGYYFSPPLPQVSYSNSKLKAHPSLEESLVS